MLYCDECAYMALAVFYKVVLPILEVLLTVLIMISTLVDAWNFFSRILDKGEEEMRGGKPRIVVFRQRLICDRCLTKRNGGTDCNHCEDDVPPWKQGTTRDLVKLLMGEENEDVFKRESMGVVAGSLMSIFPLEVAERLLNDPWYERREDIRPQHIFVGFDPNGGGTSHSAIIALARIHGTLVVLGMDSLQTYDTVQAKEFIAWFINELRRDWWLRDAHITYACENNGLTFGLMEEVMAGIENCSTVYEKPGGKPGIFTDLKKKNAYSTYLRQELSRGEGAVRFLRNFITCFGMPAGGTSTQHGAANTQDHKRAILRRETFEQAKRARSFPRPTKSAMQQPFFSWSAKCNAEGELVQGMNDDLLMSLCICLYVLRMHEMRSTIFSSVLWGRPGDSEEA